MSQEVIEITEREIEIIEVVERGPAGPSGPQANINYTVVSSPQTLSNSQNIAADTSGGAFTLTLPASPNAGDSIDIFDYSETFDTNPLTIARNGQRIESLEENLVCNVEGAYFTMIYTGSTRGWQILPRYGTSGGGGESILTNQGDTLYRGALVNERLPIGTAGQILKVNSTSTAPEWGAAPATGVTSVTGTAPIASSGGATPAISISAATTSAAGSMSSADKTKLDGIAANANNYTHPNHSGDVTSAGDGATTIANDAVSNAKLANMATATIKGRATASTGDPEDLSASQVRTILNVADGAEVNVQSNWTEANSGSDAFILNKPTLGTAAAAATTDFAAAVHAHAASDVTTGTFDNARINFAAPPAIGSTTPAAGTFTTLTANNGTLTASAPVLDLAQTWNNAAVTFTGARIDITNTASGTGSRFLDCMVGGASAIRLARIGSIPYALFGTADTGIGAISTSQASIIANGGVAFVVNSGGGGTIIRSDASYGWASGTNLVGASSDLTLSRDAADTLAQRRTTNAQTFNIYNTFTSSTNHERGFLKWNANVFQIGTEAGSGGGTARTVEFPSTNNFTGQFRVGVGTGNASLRRGDGVTFLTANYNTSFSFLAPQFIIGADGTGGPVHFFCAGNGIWEQRNTTNAQTFRIYNTFTSATNFERLNLRWASNELIIDAEAGSGGGTLRGIKIGSATSSLLGFYGVTPVDQPAAVGGIDWDVNGGGGTIGDQQDTEARAAIFKIRARLQELGLIAT
jgi:hypothetical protein